MMSFLKKVRATGVSLAVLAAISGASIATAQSNQAGSGLPEPVTLIPSGTDLVFRLSYPELEKIEEAQTLLNQAGLADPNYRNKLALAATTSGPNAPQTLLAKALSGDVLVSEGGIDLDIGAGAVYLMYYGKLNAGETFTNATNSGWTVEEIQSPDTKYLVSPGRDMFVTMPTEWAMAVSNVSDGAAAMESVRNGEAQGVMSEASDLQDVVKDVQNAPFFLAMAISPQMRTQLTGGIQQMRAGLPPNLSLKGMDGVLDRLSDLRAFSVSISDEQPQDRFTLAMKMANTAAAVDLASNLNTFIPAAVGEILKSQGMGQMMSQLTMPRFASSEDRVYMTVTIPQGFAQQAMMGYQLIQMQLANQQNNSGGF